jgi:tripartite ATP-independent transporter DctM subunit
METLLILFGTFLLLIVLSVPIAFAMAASAIVALIYGNFPMTVLMQRLLFGVDSFLLLAVPLFLLAGELMNSSGITKRIFRFAESLVGHIPGGLAHVNVLASIIFAGMSGSAVADASGLGVMEIKAMREAGYDDGFSGAVTAASSTIGPIIPPSLAMVIFGAIANVSVGRLFLGGAIPGLLLGLYMILVNILIAKRRNYPRGKKAGIKQVLDSGGKAVFCLLAPVIVVGGIIGGVFTPTEAAAVAVCYSFFVGAVLYREFDWREFLPTVSRTFLLTANIMFIVGAASIFSWLLARAKVPELIIELFVSIGGGRVLFLILCNLLLFLMGMLMETTAILLIAVPLLFPLATQLAIDPIHFGVMVVYNLSVGLITPPVGMVLFVVSGISKCSIKVLTRELLPYLVSMFFSLVLIIIYPPLVTWLPNLVFGPLR